jgi:hypothetical protein
LSADEKRTVRKLAAVLKGKGRQKRASEYITGKILADRHAKILIIIRAGANFGAYLARSGGRRRRVPR